MRSLTGILSQQQAAPVGVQPGDMWIRRNNAATTPVPSGTATPPGSWDTVTSWDTEVIRASGFDSGGYSSGEFTLPAGPYLIVANERYTPNGTSERLGIQIQMETDGGVALGGWGCAFLRQLVATDDICHSGGIFDLPSETTVRVAARRLDDNSTVTTNRVVDHGGVQILALDDNHAYGIYTLSIDQRVTAANEVAVLWDGTTRQDTGFSRTTDTITIADAGRYVCMWSINSQNRGTGRTWEWGYLQHSGTTEIYGSRGYSYSRNTEGNHQNGIFGAVMFEQTGTNTTYQLRFAPSSSGSDIRDAQIGFWKLPPGAKWAWHQATGGDVNPTTQTGFEFDTTPEIDTDTFSSPSTPPKEIRVDAADDLLVFATFEQNPESGAVRSVPKGVFDDGSDLLYGQFSAYHRADGASTEWVITGAALMPGMAANDDATIETVATGATGAVNVTDAKFSALSLSSVF